MKSVAYHPEARTEYLREVAYYLAISPLLAERYVQAVRAVETAAATTPEAWPEYKFKTRRVVERRFKFSLVYLQSDTEIQVVAVASNRRKPGYWKTRLSLP